MAELSKFSVDRAMKLVLGTSILSTLLVMFLKRKPQKSQKPFRSVPGLWFLGVLPQLGPACGNLSEKIDEFADTYGEEGVFEMVLAGTRLVCINSWPLMSKILDMRPIKVTKPSSLLRSFESTLQGIFFSEGDLWKRERRLLAPAFNAKSIASYVPAVTAMTRVLLSALRREGTVNFTELLPLYSADVICAVAFGKHLGMLENRKINLVQDVNRMMNWLSVRALIPISYWKIPVIGKHLDGASAAKDSVACTMEALMNDQAGQGATVVEKLRQMDGDKFSHKEVVGNLIILFIAGTDTTSISLSWAFYHLAYDQELQQRVADEVKDLSEEVSPQQLDSLLQVTALWLEILRFHGPTPVDVFEMNETVDLAGRQVEPGTQILVCYRHLLKNAPEVRAKLGDDLQHFRPSRWIGPEGIVKCPPFDSLAFGHGVRACLGKQLADYEGRLVIAQVLRHFILEQWTGPPLKERTTSFVAPAEDVRISLQPRSNTK